MPPPQARAPPPLNAAYPVVPPAAICAALAPDGSVTKTGVVLDEAPVPSAPVPQARTWPELVRARPNVPPAATSVTVSPDGMATDTGMLLRLVEPLPSWPPLLAPQASTWSVEVSATANAVPALTWVTVVPDGRCTGTG